MPKEIVSSLWDLSGKLMPPKKSTAVLLGNVRTHYLSVRFALLSGHLAKLVSPVPLTETEERDCTLSAVKELQIVLGIWGTALHELQEELEANKEAGA